MRISDWSSDVCSSDLGNREPGPCRRPAVSRAMPLSRLLPDVAAVPPELAITGLVLDSRSIAPGDAFVAIGGFGTHGLHFVGQARAAGASAILFEPPIGRASWRERGCQYE